MPDPTTSDLAAARDGPTRDVVLSEQYIADSQHVGSLIRPQGLDLAVKASRVAWYIHNRVHEAVKVAVAAEREWFADALWRRAKDRTEQWASAKRQDDKQYYKACGDECEKLADLIRARSTPPHAEGDADGKSE